MMPDLIRPLQIAPDCQVIDWSLNQLSQSEQPNSDHAPLVAAIGNFDGVHLGHRKLIAKACAHGEGLIPSVITFFHPHPRRYFQPDLPGFALSR